MKITELLEEKQDLDELNMAQVGGAIGKGATAVGKGIGATAAGAVQAGKNFWGGLKQGWKAGQGAVAGTDTGAAPTQAGPAAGQSSTAAPAAAGGAQPSGQPAANTQPAPTQAGPTAGQGATAAPAAAGQGGNGGGAATAPAGNNAVASLKAQIDKLDPASKKELVTALQKPAAEPAPAAAPAEPAEPAAAQPAAPAAQPAAKPTPDAATQARIDAAPQGYDPNTGKPLPAAAPAGQAPAAPATDPKAQQAALKARLQGQRAAGKSVATQTGSGFKDYVGGSPNYKGFDPQGNPIPNKVMRENVEFYSRFLGKNI